MVVSLVVLLKQSIRLNPYKRRNSEDEIPIYNILLMILQKNMRILRQKRIKKNYATLIKLQQYTTGLTLIHI